MADSSNSTTASGPDSDLLFHRIEFSGSLLSSLSYGMYLILSAMTLYLLAHHGRSYGARRLTYMYTAAMFVATTTWYISGAYVSEAIFVEPKITAPPQYPVLVTKVSAMVQYLLSDAVLLYRLYMSWDRNLRIVILPALGYATSIGFGILAELYLVGPMFLNMAEIFRLVFFVITIVFNAFTTVAIAYKILTMMRHMDSRALGRPCIQPRANSVVIILIESGALYTSIGVVFLVMFCMQSTLATLFTAFFQALTFLNPALMILRVAMGVSYENQMNSSSGGRLTPGHPDIENNVSSLKKSSPFVPDSKLALFNSEDSSDDVMTIGFGTNIESTVQSVHTDADTAVKYGPWSARHRWSMKAGAVWDEQPLTYRAQASF